jgi:hypothetical protein
VSVSSSSAALSSERVSVQRPGLALVAGLLGLPGVTLAWDLPAGGFWIGLPLAAIAIVLGVLAWPRALGNRRTMAAAAVVLGVAEVLFVAGCILFA